MSSLGNRHQTLEDLRADLRSRSQLLHKELLDLVNENYQDFLGLGSSLKGGDEKVEELKVGLLGFQSEVREVKARVAKQEQEVAELLQERMEVRRQTAEGRRLLDYGARVGRLEEKLKVDSRLDETRNEGSIMSDSSDDGEDDSDGQEGQASNVGVSVSKLRRRVHDLLDIQKLAQRIGVEHPFIMAQQARTMRLRNTILLDLGNALQQEKAGSSDRKLSIVVMYREMDAAKEAVQILKRASSRKHF